MTSSGATLASGLAGAGVAVATAVAMARRRRPYLASGHALYSAQRPWVLPAALRRRFAGATVPVRPGPRGELYVGFGEPAPGRTLRNLVLEPLRARIAARAGRLYQAQLTPFALELEFVGPERDAATLLRAYRCLDADLRAYSAMLTACTTGAVTVGPVAVTVSGLLDVRDVLAAQRKRYAFAPGSFDDIGSTSAPPTLVPAVGEPWSWRFGWDGREEICAEERHLLHGLVREAHAEGRTVRISSVPGRPRRLRPAIWTELGAAGVDLIADPDLPALARQLRGVRAVARLPDERDGPAYARIDR